MTAWTAISLAWAPLGGAGARSSAAPPALPRRRWSSRSTSCATARALRARRARARRGIDDRDRLRPRRPAAAGRSSSSPARERRAAGSSSRSPTGTPRARSRRSASSCARALAGDRARRPRMRVRAAAAAVAPLGAGVYLSFSRGAIAVAAARARGARRAGPVARAAPGRRARPAARRSPARWRPRRSRASPSLEGTPADRERDGLDRARAAARCSPLAAAALLRLARGARRRTTTAARRRAARPVAGVGGGLVVVGLVVGGLGERPSAAELARGAGAGRLDDGQLQPLRVLARRARGVRARAARPGSAPAASASTGCSERTIREAVRDVHSLELEMLAELGLVGLLALRPARSAASRWPHGPRCGADPAAAAGAAAAALVAWLLHASIDWDWQLPAVSPPRGRPRGALVAISERGLSGSSRARAANARARAAAIASRASTASSAPRGEVVGLAPHDVLDHRERLLRPPGGALDEARGSMSGAVSGLSSRAPRGRPPPGPSCAGVLPRLQRRRRRAPGGASRAPCTASQAMDEHGDGRDRDPRGRRHSSSAIRGASRLNTQTASTQMTHERRAGAVSRPAYPPAARPGRARVGSITHLRASSKQRRERVQRDDVAERPRHHLERVQHRASRRTAPSTGPSR